MEEKNLLIRTLVIQESDVLVGFWHESDWSRRKILLFLNNGMNNGSLCSVVRLDSRSYILI